MERADQHRFFLTSDALGRVGPIKEPEGFDLDTSVYEKNEDGKFFELTLDESVTLHEDAVEYIRRLINQEGADQEVRLLHFRKSTSLPFQDWELIYNYGLDLKTAEFDHELDNRSVTLEVITGGLLEDMAAAWDKEYDITSLTQSYNDDSDLPFVYIYLESRQIFRRTRWNIDDNTRVTINSTAANFSVPLILDDAIVGDPRAGSQTFLSTEVISAANTLYFNNDRAKTLRFFFDLDFEITASAENGGFISIALIKYTSGNDFVNLGYVDLKPGEPGNTISVPNELGQVLSFKRRKGIEGPIEIELLDGESLSLQFETNAPSPFATTLDLRRSNIVLEEDSTFEATCTRALKPLDFGKKLARLQGHDFDSSVFGPGGKYENMLIAHGSWLRNMPQIVQEGFEDQRRVQSETSLQDFFEAFDTVEPMRYDEKEGKFFMGLEIETQQNFTITRLVNNKGQLQEVANKRSIIDGDSLFSSIELGSEKSGNNHGEVNNIQSLAGLAKWETGVKKSKAEYKRTTKWRMGSEDVELCRIYQWADYPDQDTEYDDDWFLIDCELTNPAPGCEYSVRKWRDFYDNTFTPRNVYSVETNYNWRLVPLQLLLNHSWKVSPAVAAKPLGFINFRSSTCNSTLITKYPNLPSLASDGPIPNSRLERPTVRLEIFTFETVLTEESIDDLKGNKYGLIKFLFNGEEKAGRIIRATAQGEFEVIEAL